MKQYLPILTSFREEAEQIDCLLDAFTVVACTSEAEAQELCLRKNVHLIIVDETCEGECFSRLRSAHPRLTGLFLTSNCSKQQLHDALQQGYSGLLHKPVDQETLTDVVQQAFEAAVLREENTRLRTLLPLYSLSEKFLAAHNEQEVLDSVVDEVVRQTGAHNVSIMLYDAEMECLRVAAARGMDAALIEAIRVQPGDGISGYVFQQGRPVILNRDTQGETVFAPLLQRPDIVAAISCPLMRNDKIIGVLNISQTGSDGHFSKADEEMLAVICSQAVLALENVRSIERLQKKTRERTLLEQYVAPEVAELLLAAESNLEGVGEIKDVTVLFADIRDFTSLVQHLELNQLRSFLNDFFTLFTNTIFQHRGTVDKFMGDAVLAIFGAPVTLENSCRSAAQAALTLRDGFNDLRAQWALKRSDFKDVDLGMGVTHGQMFVGNVGSSSRLDYTVIGTQVNVAQRLAAESSSCEIFITDTVYRNIQSEFRVVERGRRTLRGVEEKITLYSLEP